MITPYNKTDSFDFSEPIRKSKPCYGLLIIPDEDFSSLYGLLPMPK